MLLLGDPVPGSEPVLLLEVMVIGASFFRRAARIRPRLQPPILLDGEIEDEIGVALVPLVAHTERFEVWLRRDERRKVEGCHG